MGNKAAWLAVGALALGIAYAVYRGQQHATTRQAVGCTFDCVECASGNVISCVRCGACASYL